MLHQELKQYVKLIKHKKSTLNDYKAVESLLKNIQVIDVFELFQDLLNEGENIESILTYVDPFIHAIDQHLKAKELELPKTGILSYLDLENQALTRRLHSLQDYFKVHASSAQLDIQFLITQLKELELFSVHYSKIQTLLFPSLEKVDDRFLGLKLLWGMQDACKNALKASLNALETKPFDFKFFSFSLGNYFFKAFGLIQKENRFLLQAALQYLSTDSLDELSQEMFEYPFVFIETPIKPNDVKKKSIDYSGYFNTHTGELNYEQLELIFNALPIDITLIDEFNKVRYFNNTQNRIFPRSSVVIGRNVRNCHPASSVEVVDKIINAMRSNEKNEAQFWIQMKGHFILIKYIALRNNNQEYKGCLEVTQLVEQIRALQGERRLLEWD